MKRAISALLAALMLLTLTACGGSGKKQDAGESTATVSGYVNRMDDYLVLLDDVGRVPSYVEMPDVAYDLLEVADRPMTIIYPGAKHLAPSLVAADGSVGIRVTREAFSRGLVERFRRPVVSTSANVSGEPSPRCFAEISEEVKRGVDYVVDFRQEETANPAPSSIIKLGVGGEIQIIRK